MFSLATIITSCKCTWHVYTRGHIPHGLSVDSLPIAMLSFSHEPANIGVNITVNDKQQSCVAIVKLTWQALNDSCLSVSHKLRIKTHGASFQDFPCSMRQMHTLDLSYCETCYWFTRLSGNCCVGFSRATHKFRCFAYHEPSRQQPTYSQV